MRKYISDFLKRLNKADVFSKKIFTILYSSAAVCMMIVSVAQVGLKSADARRFFTKIDDYEGGYFQATVNVQEDKDGEVVLHVEGEGADKASLYVNGQEYCPLSSGENTVEISDISVLEIYSPNKPVSVKIDKVSDNITMYTKNEQISVEKGIKFLCRVGKK